MNTVPSSRSSAALGQLLPIQPSSFLVRPSLIVVSPEWRRLGRDLVARGLFFSSLLAADSDSRSPGFGLVHAGVAQGAAAGFESNHALARALDAHHATLPDALARLEVAGLIEHRSGLIVLRNYRRLFARGEHLVNVDGGVVNSDSRFFGIGAPPRSYSITRDGRKRLSSPSEKRGCATPLAENESVERAPTHHLIAHWRAERAKATGLGPEQHNRRHAAVLADLWQRVGRDVQVARRVISRFFVEDHDLKRLNGASIGTFQALLDRFAAAELAAANDPSQRDVPGPTLAEIQRRDSEDLKRQRQARDARRRTAP